MSKPLIPYDRWLSGTNENSIPANDNSLRDEIFNSSAVSNVVTAQPSLSSPADDGTWYVIPAGATGTQWATFAEDSAAIFYGGTWYEFTATVDAIIIISGDFYIYESGGWSQISTGGGGSTQGRQAIYIAASGMRPSVSGGCAPISAIASAANQPDIVTLDFDPTTQEYAQFSLVMPKKWNEGTISFKPNWSHAATTTNFGVVWDLQAVAVGNDDTILTNFGTAQISTDTGGTTNDMYQGPESSAITVGGSPGPEEMVFFRVSRVTGNGGDTMAIDARLHGITVYVTTDADTDA